MSEQLDVVLAYIEKKGKKITHKEHNLIYTSYFANYRNFKKLTPTSIALYPPVGFKGVLLPEFAPSRELLDLYKKGLISNEEYTEIYTKQLNKLNSHVDLSSLDDHVLLCYEKKGDFCHRHILADWLIQKGHEVTEL